jgi:hypothetical protein
VIDLFQASVHRPEKQGHAQWEEATLIGILELGRIIVGPWYKLYWKGRVLSGLPDISGAHFTRLLFQPWRENPQMRILQVNKRSGASRVEL